MNYIEAIKNEDIISATTTFNGDKAFKTTGYYTLDFYSLIGGLRFNYEDISNLFIRSYYEDKLLTLKIMLYTRDILNGLGERNTFRMTFNMFANLNPKLAKQLIPLIPEYGRFDDLFAGMNTPIENDILKYIEMKLDEDINNYKNNKSISLLPKWLPSINTSNKEARKLAAKIASFLKLTHKEYRQLLSKLRKNTIVENNLREKDYTFDYSNVPSQAMLKYKEAFYRNDEDRFSKYLEDVENDLDTMNTSTATTTQVAYSNTSVDNSAFKNIYWNKLNKIETKTKAIVVRDGSASMTYATGNLVPLEVATSLAIYFAEQLPEPFKDHFITFSSNPKLIKLPKGTIDDKLKFIETFDEPENTDISKVYQLLLDVAKKNNVSSDDMVEQVIIISDMQFDSCVEGQSTFETYKTKFEELGLKMPELVFWNVNAFNIQYPVISNEIGVKLVSGSSQNILDSILNNDLKDITPYGFMLKTLERYSDVDKFEL